MLDFENLEGYKKAIDFTNRVYEITNSFPKSELFGVTGQLRRAALSIALNIAEGVGRHSHKERRYFYRIAKSSAYECIPLLQVSRHQTYIDNNIYSLARARCIELTKILSGLIKSVSRK